MFKVLNNKDKLKENSTSKLKQSDLLHLEEIEQEIIDIIVQVFKVEVNDIKDVTFLLGGMTNLSFIFTIKAKSYVFRIPGLGSDLLVSRSQEALVYRKIKNLNIEDVFVDHFIETK